MSRSRRFEQRVNIERAALQIVNTSELSKETPLVGLTAAAIDSWTGRIAGRCDLRSLAHLRELLISIATETGLLSDNSRAVFSSDAAYHNRTVKALMTELKMRCEAPVAP
ncbi:hypothetical protein CO661_20350 [Sinorhizobium fredii]|uniref:Uncharacterized protein n=1 Tax=Rhizobium fredii TaxID=380 RepID=A0A2A6LUD6_RHIFR|nr:hypothetical protein CO661_20350 [Sinorhizobium fredii]